MANTVRTNKEKKQTSQLESRWRRELREWGKSLFYGIVFVYFFTTFGFKAYKVEGTSMQPLLQDGERIFVNRFVYLTDELPVIKRALPLTRDPNHGDVVVFWFPREPSKYFIKRVIGVPGDVVAVRNGLIEVNGRQVNTSFIASHYLDQKTRPSTTVPPGYFFVVGDHHAKSYDSRDWGLVPRKYIIGNALIRYWPLNKLGPIRYPGNPSFYVQ